MPQKNEDFFNIAGENCGHAYSSVLLSYQLITSFFFSQSERREAYKISALSVCACKLANFQRTSHESYATWGSNFKFMKSGRKDTAYAETG